jgi:hypothetical protein
MLLFMLLIYDLERFILMQVCVLDLLSVKQSDL